MTKEPKGRVVARLSREQRNFLLRRFTPTQRLIYCFNVTHAFRVPASFGFDKGPANIQITGIHRTDRTELLLCTLNGHHARPDGRPYHITLAVADDASAKEAFELFHKEMSPNVERFDGPILRSRLQWARLEVDTPTWNDKHTQ